MTKLYIKNFQSVKNFGNNLNKTLKLIQCVMANIVGIDEFLNLTVRRREITEKEKKIMKIFSFGKSEKNQIYEMGFITLYSHFEFFMYDFVKDLFLKFPKSLNTELLFNEIRDITSVKKINEYVVDVVAIKKSYDIDKWLEHLETNYKIKIFEDQQDLIRLRMLNELRNLFMHSGGKTNTKFSKKIGAMLKIKVPINEKVKHDREKYFNMLYKYFSKLLGNLK